MKATPIEVIFLTPQQLAARWNVHPITLRRWRQAGKIKAHRFGRGIRFSENEVALFEVTSAGA
jgi:excisionase family DNA binding protein